MFTRFAFPLVLALSLTGCGSKSDSGKAPAAAKEPGSKSGSAPATVEAADEEFLIAASQKGEREKAAAGMLVDFRKKDKWSWERLDGEVNFQFQEIKAEFAKWKRDRTAAGDRYK